jgi:hypothetical protein
MMDILHQNEEQWELTPPRVIRGISATRCLSVWIEPSWNDIRIQSDLCGNLKQQLDEICFQAFFDNDLPSYRGIADQIQQRPCE